MAYLDGSGITTLTQEYDSRYIGEPASDGSSGQVLTTDGAGGRSWQTVSGGGAQTTWYGTSSTAAGTAAKVVTCSGFTLSTGAIVSVYFSTANTAATPTLNINGTGAKSIYIGSATPSATANPLKWSAYTIVTFQYDGTYFRFLGAVAAGSTVPPRGAATWYGTSSTAAATAAKAVTCANFVMTRGALISVTFSTASTVAGAITLNVNSTGAKTIYYNNAATSASNTLTWTAGETLTFMYSGSYYYLVGRDKQQSGGSTPYFIVCNYSGTTSTVDTITQTISGTSAQTVTLGGVKYASSPTGPLSLSNNRVYCAEAGFVRVVGSVQSGGNAGGEVELIQVALNGVSAVEGKKLTQQTYSAVSTPATILPVSAGDYLELKYRNYSTSPQICGDNRSTFLQVEWVGE